MVNIVTVGVDPGKSTGLAVLEDGRRIHVRQGPPAEVLPYLRQLLSACAGDPGVFVRVGCERYISSSGRGTPRTRQPDTEGVIGVVEDAARDLDIPFELHAPAVAKSLASNQLLRQLGLWVTPKDVGCGDADDANDAMRQALVQLALHHNTLLDGLLKAVQL